MSAPASERDVMNYDVAIVGAGPAGLACALRLRQLQPERSVCVVEKAASLGAHSMSGRRARSRGARCPGAGLAQRAAADLRGRAARRVPLPDRARKLPVAHATPAAQSRQLTLCRSSQLVPWLGAKVGSRRGRYLYGLSPPARRCSSKPARSRAFAWATWAARARAAKVPISPRAPTSTRRSPCLPRAAAAASASNSSPATGSMPTVRRPPSRSASRSCGSCRRGAARPGLVQHTIGWPMPRDTFRRRFRLPPRQDRVYVGLVIGLDYRDPLFQPFEAFQRFKHHPIGARPARRAARPPPTARAPSPPAARRRCRAWKCRARC